MKQNEVLETTRSAAPFATFMLLLCAGGLIAAFNPETTSAERVCGAFVAFLALVFALSALFPVAVGERIVNGLKWTFGLSMLGLILWGAWSLIASLPLSVAVVIGAVIIASSFRSGKKAGS